jgi:CBS domain-containing protein
MPIPKQLQEMVDRVERGEAADATVRKLLRWFGAERRGVWVIERVRGGLKEAKLQTAPDFESAWIDQAIVFRSTKESKKLPQDLAKPLADFVPKLGNLKAAQRPVVRVSRDDELIAAVTEMLLHDYSQLPVMQGRDVLGMVSWRSIGRASVSAPGAKFVREVMDKEFHSLEASFPLSRAIDEIIEHEVVLVRDVTGGIVGIVTTANVSEEYRRMSEPFMLFGELENHIRALIGPNYSLDELRALRLPGDREVNSPTDLSFGQYIRLLENPSAWDKAKLKLERSRVMARLRALNVLRNDVMHFNVDRLSEEQSEQLLSTVQFFREVVSRI